MAALSDDYNAKRKLGELISYQVGVDVIYKNALVEVNSSGYLVAADDTSANEFVGVAYEQVDNSGGSAGDEECRVVKTGSFKYSMTGAGQSDVGSKVYVSDDQTVTTTAGNNAVGYIVEYPESGKVRVRIDGEVH